jgi:hypothetical protein
MFNDFDKNIMLKFLTNNYPVNKIKDNKRFKRVVTSHDGQKYFLSLSHTQDELRRQFSAIFSEFTFLRFAFELFIGVWWLKSAAESLS